MKVLEKLNIAGKDFTEAVEILKKSRILTPGEIREHQLNRFFDLGFHDGYGMTKEELASLTPEPEEGKENPLLVAPQVIITHNRMYVLDLTRMMELVVVDWKKGKNCLDLAQVKDLVETPHRPYWIYEVKDGRDMKGISPNDCVKQFDEQGRRGLVSQEGIALVIQNPEVLKHCSIDLPGSRYRSDDVPFLDLWEGGPELRYGWTRRAHSRYGSASCRKLN